MLRKYLALRIYPDALALVIILIALSLQNALSGSLDVGGIVALRARDLPSDAIVNQATGIIEIVIFGAALILWAVNHRAFLRAMLIAGNALLTVELLTSIFLLVATLNRFGSADVPWLIQDTFLILLINILTFALWYWLIDARHHAPKPVIAPPDFLFPQHANAIKGYENWRTNFWDYLFLAAITTTSFGPAETIPLSRRAKLLVMLQVAISLVTLSVLAARTLSMLSD
jgi:hypothetical protein